MTENCFLEVDRFDFFSLRTEPQFASLIPKIISTICSIDIWYILIYIYMYLYITQIHLHIHTSWHLKKIINSYQNKQSTWFVQQKKSTVARWKYFCPKLAGLEGPFPSVLLRTPYGRKAEMGQSSSGFVFVVSFRGVFKWDPLFWGEHKVEEKKSMVILRDFAEKKVHCLGW